MLRIVIAESPELFDISNEIGGRITRSAPARSSSSCCGPITARPATAPAPRQSAPRWSCSRQKPCLTVRNLPINLRVANHRGKLYLDLCDRAWRAVEIGCEGWRVIAQPPVKFAERVGRSRCPNLSEAAAWRSFAAS